MNVNNLSGQNVGQYHLIQLLGVGGMGAVYLANQMNLNREVAIKILNANIASDPEHQSRFEREARMAASLTHLHIVSIFDYGIEDGFRYVAMPYISGGSLAQRYANIHHYEQPIPTLQETTRVIQQIASALDYAHERGVIHRDVKPGNIMFDEQGNAFLADFGIARLMTNSSLTATGLQLGTPAYMPPEQWQGKRELTQATDQYALAVLTFQLITGRLPFEAENPPAMMHAHIYQPPPPLQVIRGDLPQAMTYVIHRALAKNPAERFASVGEFSQALNQSVELYHTEKPTQFFQTLIAPNYEYQHKPTPSSYRSSQIEPPAASPWLMRILVGLGAIGLVIATFLITQLLPESYSEVELTATAEAIRVASLPTETATLSDAEIQQTAVIQYQTSTAEFIDNQTQIANLWTATPTLTATSTPTVTPSHTSTLTATSTSTNTSTPTPTLTPSQTSTPTHTATASPTLTETYTATVIPSETSTVTPSATLTKTSTPTSTSSRTPTLTKTATKAPSLTPTFTRTHTATPIAVATSIPEPCEIKRIASLVAIYVGPNESRTVRGSLSNDWVEVTGQARDESNPTILWWRIFPSGSSKNESDRYWVKQDDVATRGNCDDVNDVDGSEVIYGRPASTTTNTEPAPSNSNGYAPEILSYNMWRDDSGGTLILHRDMRVRDLDGDALWVRNYVVNTDMDHYTVNDGRVNATASEQRNGITVNGTWYCGSRDDFMTLRTIIVDRNGNQSNAIEFTYNCRG